MIVQHVSDGVYINILQGPAVLGNVQPVQKISQVTGHTLKQLFNYIICNLFPLHEGLNAVSEKPSPHFRKNLKEKFFYWTN